MGYTVIASYKAKKEDKGDKSPHFATVRPGFKYDDINVPMMANVDAHNLIGRAKNPDCFDKGKYKDIEWYYDPNQEFRCEKELWNIFPWVKL